MNVREAQVRAQLRELIPYVLAVMTRRCRDFCDAEDAVQEAALAASVQWARDGLPEEPRAWLLRVASRRLTDKIRETSARRKRESLVVSLIPPEEQLALAPDEDDSDQDDSLALLFMCCHPVLSPASTIALTLRAVGGLTTAEIAKAFLVPEATMAQRISRAKQNIKTSGIPFQMPSVEELSARLGNVMHVLYLIFSEGHTATSGEALHRVDLSQEAIRLTRHLHRLAPTENEVSGLLALMLLTDARRTARVGPLGEIIPLDQQDRSRWDRAFIDEGTAILKAALSQGMIGPYQLQATISVLHCEAKSTEETDWQQILGLYGLLRRIADSPMLALNEAIAAAMVHGVDVALERLEALAQDPLLAEHHRLFAARAHLLERAGDKPAAILNYQRAAQLTANTPERNYLLAHAAMLRDGKT